MPPRGIGPDAPLQDQMPHFIIHVCQAVLKRTFKLLKRSKIKKLHLDHLKGFNDILTPKAALTLDIEIIDINIFKHVSAPNDACDSYCLSHASLGAIRVWITIIQYPM